MNKMIVANLVHRPIRSLISIVAIALEVTLILLIVGLSVGTLTDARDRQAGIGADVIVQPPNSSFIQGLSSAPVPIKVGDIIRRLPHVAQVSPVITMVSTAGTVEVIYGIDLKSFEALGSPFRYIEGGPFQTAQDVLVDDYFARSQHANVGDSITILNHQFRIAGIVEHGKGARKFLPITALQDINGSQGKASVFYVKLDDPANADAVVKEVRSVSWHGTIRRPLHERVPFDDDPCELPRIVEFYRRSHLDISDYRFHRHLPGHVHSGDGTHSRNWDSQVPWRFEVLHRKRNSAGNRIAGDCRNSGRNRFQPGSTRRNPSSVANSERYRQFGMDIKSYGNCSRRRDCRSAVSSLQSGTKRSHRRVGL